MFDSIPVEEFNCYLDEGKIVLELPNDFEMRIPLKYGPTLLQFLLNALGINDERE